MVDLLERIPRVSPGLAVAGCLVGCRRGTLSEVQPTGREGSRANGEDLGEFGSAQPAASDQRRLPPVWDTSARPAQGQTTSTRALRWLRYDGQMPMQDEGKDNGTYSVCNYDLGGRGIDMQEYLNSSYAVTSTTYPIYNAHGDNTCVLVKSGTNSYSLSDYRTYGAWGENRSNTNGKPNRYCAALGHKADDDSGLAYMRARYYDTNRGRFISEDEHRIGENWFVYAGNDPANRSDLTGHMDLLSMLLVSLIHEWAEKLDAQMQLAAKKWAENKAESIASRYAGQVAGWLAGMEIDMLDYESGGVGALLWRIGEEAGGNYVLLDLMNGVFEKGMFSPDGTLAVSREFFEGFMESFMKSLGL